MAKENETPPNLGVRSWYISDEQDSRETVPHTPSSVLPDESAPNETFNRNNDVLISGDVSANENDLPTKPLPEVRVLDETETLPIEDSTSEPTIKEEQIPVTDNFISESEAETQALPVQTAQIPTAEIEPETKILPIEETPLPTPADEVQTQTLPVQPTYLQEDQPQDNTVTQRHSLLNGVAANKIDNAVTENPSWSNIYQDRDAIVAENNETKPSLEETIFEGATVTPTIPSRLAAHLWSILLAIILAPLAWYYTIDVASRLNNPATSPWFKNTITTEIALEMVAATVCVFLIVWLARYSSVGSFLMGLVHLGIGLPYLFVPGKTKAVLDPLLHTLNTRGEGSGVVAAISGNLGHHLQFSFSSGLFIFMGIILIALGFTSHGARRKGRKDYLVEQKVKKN